MTTTPTAHLAPRSRSTLPVLVLATLVACNGGEDASRQTTPSTLVLGLAPAAGPLERPAVEFEHGKHTTALEKDGCGACHEKSASGDYSFVFKGAAGAASSVERQNRYHDACIGCHQQRRAAKLQSGPLTCGECHVDRAPAAASRVDPDFDYSLHARHVKAASDKCETCHHVFNQATKKLEYQKGAESACADCHGDVDVGKNLSLGHASHMQCINCHQRRVQAAQKTGPVICVGCHDAARFGAVARLPDVPRLMRGQPDTLWVKVGDAATAARFALVPFDHKAHESTGRSCSTCHHKTLQSCASCHTVGGDAKGGGVTLEAAFHQAGSPRSCVGCHLSSARAGSCAGCHRTAPESPAASSCLVCHRGPPPSAKPELPPPAHVRVELPPLPAYSKDFPETVELGALKARYQASKLPHGKIVTALDAAARKGELASVFHGRIETLCAGCHHQSPVGTRPPPCASCHSPQGGDRIDQPGLRAALHRQCMGCHESVHKPLGCTACHQPAKPGVQP